MTRRLLELAVVGQVAITLADEALVVVEPSGMQSMEYRKRRAGIKANAKLGLEEQAGDIAIGMAYLFRECVFHNVGTKDVPVRGEPAFTEEEALLVARGRDEVALPLTLALFSFAPEKKVNSAPKNSSGTDSLLPSGYSTLSN